MKKLSLLLAIGFAFTACSNNATKEDTHSHEMNVAGSEQIAEGPLDPICHMPKGDDWTEFTVVDNDTTWFCSPHCKETFDKDPAKYTAK